MTDIFEYIHADHQKVEKLFNQFEKESDEKQMLEIANKISVELLLHSKSEENTFYKAIKADPEYKQEITHAKDEHDKIAQLIEEINSIDTDNEKLKKLVLTLKEEVMHHVKEEEGKLFSDAKKILSAADAKMLKEKMENYKENNFKEITGNLSYQIEI